MLLLARTTPYDALEDKTRGLSAFIVDLREAKGKIEVKPLDLMINHHTTALFFDGLEVPVENLIGQEGMGFRYIIDGWNAERILVAAEAIGDGRWFIERAAKYAGERVVFGRPIGANQGVQFPIAQAYTRIEAADLVRFQAATLFDHEARWLRFCHGVRCGAKVPRDAASHRGAGEQQSRARLSGAARFRNAEVLLMPIANCELRIWDCGLLTNRKSRIGDMK